MSLQKQGNQVASGTGWGAVKFNGLVELRFNGFDSATTGETLPAGFRPQTQTYTPVSCAGAAGARIAISANGLLTPQLYTGQAWGLATYRAG